MARLVYSQRARVDWKAQASRFFRIASGRFRGCGKIAQFNNIENTHSNTTEAPQKTFLICTTYCETYSNTNENRQKISILNKILKAHSNLHENRKRSYFKIEQIQQLY